MSSPTPTNKEKQHIADSRLKLAKAVATASLVAAIYSGIAIQQCAEDPACVGGPAVCAGMVMEPTIYQPNFVENLPDGFWIFEEHSDTWHKWARVEVDWVEDEWPNNPYGINGTYDLFRRTSEVGQPWAEDPNPRHWGIARLGDPDGLGGQLFKMFLLWDDFPTGNYKVCAWRGNLDGDLSLETIRVLPGHLFEVISEP